MLKMCNLGKVCRLLPHVDCLLRQFCPFGGIKLRRAAPSYGGCQRRLFSSSQRLEHANESIGQVTDDVGDETAAKQIDPRKDRTKQIPVELSLKYMRSDAYKTTYGDNLVWKLYRRNHKLQFPQLKTRLNCIKKGVIRTGNPCPICRDEYLVVDYRNVELLRQFISPTTDEIIDAYYTGVCQFQHFKIRVAVEKARDFGYLTFSVPHRSYDYSEFYPNYGKKP